MNEVENRAFKTTGNILVFGTEELNHGNLLHQWNQKNYKPHQSDKPPMLPTNEHHSSGSFPLMPATICFPAVLSSLLNQFLCNFSKVPLNQTGQRKEKLYRPLHHPVKTSQINRTFVSKLQIYTTRYLSSFPYTQLGEKEIKGKKGETNI